MLVQQIHVKVTSKLIQNLGFILALGIQITLFAQNKGANMPLSNAEITFAEKTFDFGDVQQGSQVTHKFVFQNTGTEPLMVLQVQTTCGCTASDWPKKPIPPGESAEIVVNFNSAKKVGRQNKIITIYTNGKKAEEKLKIVANVLIPVDQPLQSTEPSIPIEPKK